MSRDAPRKLDGFFYSKQKNYESKFVFEVQ